MTKTRLKIDEKVRSARVKRVEGNLAPSVTYDTEVPGFALYVTTKRAFWAVTYAPRGVNPNTGKRWGGGVRHELGDAYVISVADARAAARTAKAEVSMGRDPHRERMATRAAAVAERSITTTTLAEALDDYEKDMLKRREPSEATRKQEIHYAKKAVALMKVGALAVNQLNAAAVRKLLRQADGSGSEIRHLYGSLSRFCEWMTEEKLVTENFCEEIPRKQRPKSGKVRENVPSVEHLRAIWEAVGAEDPAVRDLVRFLLLVPLRRDEAAGLVWEEVDLDRGWITIPASRMKNRMIHELPLASEALSILKNRMSAKVRAADLVFPSGEQTIYSGWSRLLARIRKQIGQKEAGRDTRFTLHDIRRSFTTLQAELFDESLLDLIIAHKPASRRGSGAAYQKAKRLNERSGVMASWARMVLGETQANVVVPLVRLT